MLGILFAGFFFFSRCRNKGLERLYSALLEGMLQNELSKLGLQLQTLPPSRPPHLAHFSLSPHLMHTSEQLPVEGSKVVGYILGLHSVDLCVSRGDLDFLRQRHLVAGRGTGLGSLLGF